jgi:hypothetical protein
MNATQTRDLHAILADLADFTVASSGTRAATLYHELEDTLRAQLASLPEGAAGRMAAEADRAARTMAPPVPGVSQNSGYTVRAVIHMHDAEPGLLEQWVVACQGSSGEWVTWNAYSQGGRLAYEAGNYFGSTGERANRRAALADLAIRAGTMSDVGLRIAHEVTRYHDIEDRRMASRLRRWCQG